MLVAVTRGVSPNIEHCELTYLEREPIDLASATSQHALYERVLADLGCRVEHLDEEPDFPDSVFVEDIAVVLEEMALITRPGALSRRGERPSVERVLEPYRRLSHIQGPGILDGGDVLAVGRNLYVGISTRSNIEAVNQLRTIIANYGYTVIETGFRGCLHLKSAATAASDDTLLVNPEWIDTGTFEDVSCIPVHPAEPRAANVARVGDTLLFAADFPRTGERLSDAGFDVQPVQASELAKAEGALTCCSLLFEVPDEMEHTLTG